jgi:hypothetical protein
MSSNETVYFTIPAAQAPTTPILVNSVAEETMIFLERVQEKSRRVSNMVKEKLRNVMVETHTMETENNPESEQEYPPYFKKMRLKLENTYNALEEIEQYINRTAL